MISKQFTKLAAATGLAISLSACATSSMDYATVGTLAGGLAGATMTRDSSNYDRALAIGAGALVGNVIGGAFTPPPNPCVTRQSGRVTETNGRYSQRQDTRYDCVYSGRPGSAQSPEFRQYRQYRPY